MKVELKIGKWGWRYVHVDGRAEPWAEIHWDSHGPRGRTWHWRDPITHRRLMIPDGADKERPAEIRTQRPYGGEVDVFPGDPGAHRPTNERLLKVSEQLIADGHIVNPAATRAAMRKKEEARKRKAAQARERERKRLEKRAASCIQILETHCTGGLPLSKHWQQKIVANIVAAMKWAQTR